MTIDPSPRRRRWWKNPFVLAGVALLVVASVTVILVFDDKGTPQEASPLPRPPVVEHPAVPTTAPQDYLGDDVDVLGRGFRIPGNPAGRIVPGAAPASPARITSPLTAPRNLEWQRVFGVPMPFSASDGPTSITDGVAHGFTQTPQGAALASLQLMMRLSYGSDEVRATVVQGSVGGDEDLRSELLAAGAPADLAKGQTIAAAVRITADQWTSRTALVQWAFGPFAAPEEFPTPTGYAYTTMSIPVVWTGTDWALRLGTWMRAGSEASADAYMLPAIDEAGWSTWF